MTAAFIGWVRRTPFTLAFIAATVIVVIGTRTFLHPLPRAAAGVAGLQSTDLFHAQ